MPPQLALILCSGFVLVLLRYDRQLSRDVSGAAWLATLWIFSIGTKPLGVWFASTSGDQFGSPLDQYFQIALLLSGLLVLAQRQFDASEAIRKEPWLFVLVGYMLVSILWSELPVSGVKRWMRQLVAVVMAFVVLSDRDPRQAVESILRRSAYVLIPFSMLLIKYYPHYGVEFHRWSGDRMWVGVAQQKNGLARMCIIGVLYLVWALVRRWRGREPWLSRCHVLTECMVLVLGAYLLFLPDGKASATSVAAFVSAVSVLCGLGWLRGRGVRLHIQLVSVIVLALCTLGLALAFGHGPGVSGLTAAMGRDETLTGRADTWAELVPVVMEHPLFGCGFESYWSPVTRERHQMSNAHNAYLEVINELGAVGFLIFAMFLRSVAQRAQQAMAFDYEWGTLCLGYIGMALIHGCAESSTNSFSCHLAGTLLLLGISCTAIIQWRHEALAGKDEPPIRVAANAILMDPHTMSSQCGQVISCFRSGHVAECQKRQRPT